jgi:transaldolase
MVGRMDDWLRVVAARDRICVDPGILNWAGIAVMKNAYVIYKERGYRTRLLAAAYRCHMHWSEFIGGDVVLTIPHEWQKLFNSSDVNVTARMDQPVNRTVFTSLYEKFEDFRKAHDEHGLTVEQFVSFGPTLRTLRQFLSGYDTLVRVMRDRMVPDPDQKRGKQAPQTLMGRQSHGGRGLNAAASFRGWLHCGGPAAEAEPHYRALPTSGGCRFPPASPACT